MKTYSPGILLYRNDNILLILDVTITYYYYVYNVFILKDRHTFVNEKYKLYSNIFTDVGTP